MRVKSTQLQKIMFENQNKKRKYGNNMEIKEICT